MVQSFDMREACIHRFCGELRTTLFNKLFSVLKNLSVFLTLCYILIAPGFLQVKVLFTFM